MLWVRQRALSLSDLPHELCAICSRISPQVKCARTLDTRFPYRSLRYRRPLRPKPRFRAGRLPVGVERKAGFEFEALPPGRVSVGLEREHDRIPSADGE